MIEVDRFFFKNSAYFVLVISSWLVEPFCTHKKKAFLRVDERHRRLDSWGNAKWFLSAAHKTTHSMRAVLEFKLGRRSMAVAEQQILKRCHLWEKSIGLFRLHEGFI